MLLTRVKKREKSSITSTTQLTAFSTRKNKKLLRLGVMAVLAMIVFMLPEGAQATVTCPAGYKSSGGTCAICDAGKECSGGGSSSGCSTGEYSLKGFAACLPCPAGHSCSSKSSMPVPCEPGKYVNSNSCSSCTGTKVCADPTTPTTCTNGKTIQASNGGNVGCEPCPAGKKCSGGSASGCSTDEFSEIGEKSCSSPGTSKAAPSPFFEQTCLAGTYQLDGDKGECKVCPVSKSCNASGSTTNCVSPKQSGPGDSTCQSKDAGYKSSGTTLDRSTCGTDKIETNQSCDTCAVSKSCDLQASTTTNCPSGTFSESGQAYCAYIPAGKQFASGSIKSCGGSKYFDPTDSTCKSCPATVKCDPNTGTQTLCQATQWLKITGSGDTQTRTCEDCPAGKYCIDGSPTKTATSSNYMAYAKTNAQFPCPPGYLCTSSTHTACADGQTSDWKDSSCTATKDWIGARDHDSSGANCPSEGKQSSATKRHRCDLSPLDVGHNSATTANACIQASAGTAWYAEACTSCPGTGITDRNHVCRAMTFFFDSKCNPGKKSFNGDCITEKVRQSEFQDGIMTACKAGMYTSGDRIATHTNGLQCMYCPELTACNAKIQQPKSQGVQQNWCWGQKLAIKDDYEKVFYLQLHDRRLPQYEHQECQDCNDWAHRSQICTFTTHYFTHNKGYDLMCPFQTEERTVTRYDFPNTHSGTYYTQKNLAWSDGSTGIKRCSTYNCEKEGTGTTHQVSYTSKVWFEDNEVFEYPYCKSNYNYFLDFVLDDHESTYDEGEKCSLYEHRTANYRQCEPNYAGFISPTTSDTFTETPVGNDRKYYSVMEENSLSDYTGNTLKSCPQYTWNLKDNANVEYKGGSNWDACYIRKLGECVDSRSEYCHGGGDYNCAAGFELTSGAKVNTADDCVACAANSFCVFRVKTACPTGFQCPAYSFDGKSHPAQPGAVIATSPNVAQCTKGKYCPGAEGTVKSCPTGFNHEFGGSYAEADNYSTLSCQPDAAGTGCEAGKYCPEGAALKSDKIDCPAGTSIAGSAGKNANDCTDCAAGKWCPHGTSSESAVACPNGSYCPVRTYFDKEFGCPHGKTSTGANAEAACSACPAGSWCREGETETNLCDDEGYACPSGSARPQWCTAGTYTKSGATAASTTCSSCEAGYHCPGYAGRIDCRKGYFALANQEDCATTVDGKFTAADQAGTQTVSASGKWAIPGDIEERDCPRGFSCASGTKTICPKGKFCAQGASSAASPTNGMVNNEEELWFEKPCPSGKFCAAGVTTAPADVSVGYYTKQGEKADSTNKCNAGYTCPAKSIGPYQQSCKRGEWTASDTSSGCTTASCVNGKECKQGANTDAPAGFYTLTGTPDPTECPIGTLRATVGGDTNDDNTCVPCTQGSSCNHKSSTKVTSQCAAGYFCNTRATSTTPKQICRNWNDALKECDFVYLNAAACPGKTLGASAVSSIAFGTALTHKLCQGIVTDMAVCPQGFYCPKGSMPTQCDAGQFSTSYAAVDNKLCIDCTPGFCCGDAAQTSARQLCTGGNVCPLKTSACTGTKADKGYFTENGYPAQVKCLYGTYQDTVGQSACLPCELGKYCETLALQAGVPCIDGHDCSKTSTMAPMKCQMGWFSDDAANGECKVCPVDKYCAWHGIKTSEQSACPDGYDCMTNTPVQYPNWMKSESADFHLCDKGHQCAATNGLRQATCTEGTYMPRFGAVNAAACVPCPAGYKCASAGTVTPAACDVGQFCAEGSGSSSHSTKPTDCPAGTYCPIWDRATTVIGTADAAAQTDGLIKYTSSTYPNKQPPGLAFECEWGKYASGLKNAACTDCQAGTMCAGKKQAAEGTCTDGYYCLLGDAAPRLCDEGFKTVGSTIANKDLKADCQTLTKNDYIKTVVQIGKIADGYWSKDPGESWSIPTKKGELCVQGWQCVGGDRAQCSLGKYCDRYQLAAATDNCDKGFYCIQGTMAQGGSKNARPTDLVTLYGDRCVSGSWCGIGVSVGTQCAKGTFNSGRGLTEADECRDCPMGYNCNVVGLTYEVITTGTTYLCPAGKECVMKTGNIISTAIVPTDCPYGKKCPQGSMAADWCEPGYYQDTQAQSKCEECDKGHHCPYQILVSNSQKVPCPAGHECPSKLLAEPVACAAGKFKAASSTDFSACDKCTKGKFCPYAGTIIPLACPDQHYCPEESSVPIRCVNGQVCLASESVTQETFVKCRAGKYCLAGKEADCYAGYYCLEGSITAIPLDGKSGNLCPQGAWCPAGTISSAAATECAIGKYNSFFGAEVIAECLPCSGSQDCSGLGTIYPTAKTCPGGYYCDGVNGEQETNLGMYSPEGISMELKCPDGSYNDLKKNAACKRCAKGKYCVSANAAVAGPVAEADCPEGHYCPEDTAQYGRYPCDIGTYGAAENLESSDQCTKCPATFYCPVKGMKTSTSTTFKCKLGYICDAGSSVETGTKSCPIDKFCIDGTPQDCPDGTFSLIGGITKSDECIECPPGKYCPTRSVSQKQCPAGYFCEGNLKVAPTTTFCTAGHYCPLGSFVMTKCEPGTYQDGTKESTCKACPAGSHCPDSGMATHTSCTTSFTNWYCPAGSIQPKKCPIGTYASADTQSCTQCPNGEYCWPCPAGEYCFPTNVALGNDGRVGKCDISKGFVCRLGAHSPEPTYNGFELIQANSVAFSTYSGPVIRGYIAKDDGTLNACLKTTYQPTFYGQSCETCMQGRYCPDSGMDDAKNNLCKAGYLCKTGLSVPTPVALSQGDVCTLGKFCSGNLIHEMDCPDGFYSDKAGLAICTTCPVGKFCNAVDSKTPVACIAGSTCEFGLKRQPLCPSGTYQFTNKLVVTPDVCLECPETWYCRAGVQVDKCVAGYICKAGLNTVPNPSIGQCPEGYYCPKGATYEVRCPFETMSVQTAQRQITDCRGCQPGWVCEWGKYDYYPCPKGHWCPIMGEKIVYKEYVNKCEPGTYSSWDKRVWQNECSICPEGFACDDFAITNLTSRECPKGHYCPTGTAKPLKCAPGSYYRELGGVVQADCQPCPVGSYCPEGCEEPIMCSPGHFCPSKSSTQVTCPGGYYCNEDNDFAPRSCPINHYCERGSSEPIECKIDEKYICLYRTEVPRYCGPGSEVRDNRRVQAPNSCQLCLKGEYSDYVTDGCEPCRPGYVCFGGTNTAKPTDLANHKGIKCPKGHYCPEGTYEPRECPPGSYNPEEGRERREDCLLCAPGTFQDKWGKPGCRVCGQFADSVEGQDICECTGKHRAYSTEDATCRCKSGFDFIDSDEQSKGNISDITDCFPLVFNNCAFDGGSGARQPDGTCVEIDDCADACNGSPGKRSTTIGICSCEQTLSVDEICNQACRKAAPKITFKSSFEITLSTAAGSTQLPLNQAGNFYGKLEKCRSESNDCAIKTADIGSQGFEGNYNLPSTITKALLRRRRLGHHVHDELMEHVESQERRRLQTESSNKKIFNPLYCINAADSFIFSIDDPNHYPVYMKNSVMNSNDVFDYGAFNVLEEDMLRLNKEKVTAASIFAFTFPKPGTYVFNDSADSQKIMVIQVMGPGEECADSDRFVQTITENSMSEQGVSQRGDLILHPNYTLLAAMGALLIFATLLIMISIGFCLHKGWKVSELNTNTYRDYQLPINIHHEDRELFERNNDFVNFKSDLIDSDEDDLDHFNLDIQFDLIDAGDHYLKMYNKRKMKHKHAKVKKRDDVKKLLSEIEALMSNIGNSAMGAQMTWLDLEAGGEYSNEKLVEQIEQELAALNAREKEEDVEYQRKKTEMMKDASDRDLGFFKGIQNKINSQQNQFNKEMNNAIMEPENIVVTSEQAIYDNGDVNSRNNKYVAAIQNDDKLSAEEKERLLKNHEQNIVALSGLIDGDKKRQEQELDRMLKERLERRRKLLEKQHSKEIKEESQAAEKHIEDEYAKKTGFFLTENKAQQQAQLQEALKEEDYNQQREGVKRVEAKCEQAKKDGLADLEREKHEKIEAEKQRIRMKFTAGAKDEEEMRNQLVELMQGNSGNYQSMLRDADAAKGKQDGDLQDRLARRRKANEDKLAAKQADIQEEFDNMDIEQIYEQERAADNAQVQLVEEKEAATQARELQKQASHGTLPGAKDSAHPSNDNQHENDYIEKAKQEEDKRKHESKKKVNKINDEIDNELEKSRLMNQLQGIDDALVSQLEDDQAKQADSQAARRALLLARRKNRKKHELEEERVKDKVKLLEQEDEEKEKISEEYIRNLFQTKLGSADETPEQKEKKLQLLNEFLSDQFLERMSGLLMKQFTEKEQMLKLLLSKYADQQHAETDAVKQNFKIEKEKLDQIKDQVSDDQYKDMLKNLRLSEENLLRDVDLKIQNAHKTEEAALRKELEKKHTAEQMDFRTKMANDQGKLRRQLIADKSLTDGEQAADKQAIEKYERQKKQEQERRLRNIELQKKTMQNTFEKELSNRFSNYEDMLKWKREQQGQMEEDAANLRTRIQERQEKLKAGNKEEEMSKDQQAALLNNLSKQLESIDNAWIVEQQRQALVLKQKIGARKGKVEKARKLREQLEKQEASQAAKHMQTRLKDIFKRQGTIVLQEANDNSELMRRLRAWKIAKKNATEHEHARKLAEVEVDLDENETKIMILKLLQTEKMLKEIRRQIKKTRWRATAGVRGRSDVGSDRSRVSKMSRQRSAQTGLGMKSGLGLRRIDSQTSKRGGQGIGRRGTNQSRS